MADESRNPEPAWRACLDFEAQPPDHYHEFVCTPLFDLMTHAPRRVLELGCATGAFGAELKRRHPGASVVGIDAGKAAAERAAARLDRVIRSMLDGFDFEAAGLRPGEFDTVIAADILEHLVNPWDLLVRLKPFLASGAQVLTSIPNVRNLRVSAQLLLEGRFDYAERGVLDVTHLRFFTLDSMRRMFRETGYAVEETRGVMLPALEQTLADFVRKAPAALRVGGRVTIENVTAEEMTELCTVQFLMRCRPAPA